MAKIIPRTEFAAAVSQLAKERGVDPDIVLNTIQTAIMAAFRKDAKERNIELDEALEYEIHVDPASGSVQIIGWHPDTPEKREDMTPPGFGRIAAQTAKQVIIQKIREAEKGAIIDSYRDRVDSLINGMILRFDGPAIVVDLGKAQAVMPPHEQVASENYELNQRKTFYIDSIRQTPRGEEIVVSRAHKQLVTLLFKREVPEVNSGSVEIAAIAREPGARTKIAVSSTQPGVDPVGSCVGQKGVRVQAVINELNGEKIDIIEHSQDIHRFIAAAISPAEAESVKVDEDSKTATITVPDDQLSLAIGKDGQNVRLAAKLTGYKLDVVGTSGLKPTSARSSDDSTSPAAPVADDQASSKTAEATSELATLGLSTRTISALEKQGITTTEQLKAADLENLPGVGPKSREEIQAVLKS